MPRALRTAFKWVSSSFEARALARASKDL